MTATLQTSNMQNTIYIAEFVINLFGDFFFLFLMGFIHAHPFFYFL